jgi:hypothetical protein
MSGDERDAYRDGRRAGVRFVMLAGPAGARDVYERLSRNAVPLPPEMGAAIRHVMLTLDVAIGLAAGTDLSPEAARLALALDGGAGPDPDPGPPLPTDRHYAAGFTEGVIEAYEGR